MNKHYKSLVFQLMRVYTIDTMLDLPKWAAPEKQFVLNMSREMLWASIAQLNPSYYDLQNAGKEAKIASQIEMGIIAPIMLN